MSLTGDGRVVSAQVLMVLRSRTSLRTFCRPYGTSQASTNKIGQNSRWPGWEVIIGIETHAQIKSRKKLFSRGSEQLAQTSAHTSPFLSETWTPEVGSKPNSHVSPYDAAFPGTLPVSNQLFFGTAKGSSRPFLAYQFYMHKPRSQNCPCTSIRHSTAFNV